MEHLRSWDVGECPSQRTGKRFFSEKNKKLLSIGFSIAFGLRHSGGAGHAGGNPELPVRIRQ
jgi:hypothetical protein